MRRLGAVVALWVVVVASMLGGPRVAWAQVEEGAVAAARAHEQGMARYAARDFAAAARAFAAAYALDPRRESLFAQAQATRLAGDCATATRLYRDFLATAPPQQQVEATELALARCQSPREVPLPASAAPAVVPVPPPVIASAPAEAVPPPPWWRDRLGLGLAAGAAAGAGLAGGLFAAAANADGEARAAGGYRQYEERRGVAEGRARWAGRAALLGLVLAAGAGTRFLWVRFGPREGGAGLNLEARF